MIKRRNRTFKHQASQPPQAKYRRMAEIVRARLEARKKAEEEEAEQKQRAETEPERKYSPHRSVDPSDGLTNGSAGSAGDKATAGSVAPNTNSSGVVVKQEPGTAGSLASKDRADQNDADDEVPSEEAIAEMNEEVDALKKQKSLLYFKLKEILRVEQVCHHRATPAQAPISWVELGMFRVWQLCARHCAETSFALNPCGCVPPSPVPSPLLC
eukprot:scaffold49965_cov32-Tisochrysis_lutea.AAC.1